jgi:tetratricopeptide (TPR) repeat protein
MLADAAVIGKVFWAGAVARIGDRDPGEVRTTMDQFARMELVRPAVRSSMAGDAEYAFWHVLTRDVAYAQLPRSARAKRHAAAARWLEGQSGDRAEDIADVLAHHWATALELATASAQPATAEESLPKALRFLTLAGDRALGLDTASAVGNYERALAVLPADHPDRPATLVRYGKAILNAGRAQEALDAMNEAVEAFHARGDVRSEALALIASAAPMEWLGQSGLEISERVVAMLEPLGPSAELVDALLQRASSDIGAAADVRPALELIDRALEMADSLGIPTPSRAYGLRGWGRVRILDRGGFDDFRRAIAMFEERGAAREAGITRMNLGSYITFLDGPREAAGVARDGLELVAGRGMPTVACILASNLTTALVDQGAFDDALEVIARWLGPTDALGNRGDGVAGLLRRSRAQIAWWRGDSTTLVDMVAELRQAERAIAHDDVWVTLAGFVAMALAEAGDRDGAAALLDAVETWPLDERDFSGYFDAALTLVRASIGIGDVARAERLIVMPARWPLIDHILATAGALIAEAQGDLESAVVRFAEAADRWQTFGVATEEALARLGHGRCLVRLARAAEARGSLARARELVTGMGAAPKLAELDALAASAAGV